MHVGFYCVFLKEIKCGVLKCGCNYYDYQEGTVVFVAPGQILGVSSKGYIKPKGWVLLFHPDLLRGTPLGQTIKNYSFFSYEANEALHLSEKERQVVVDCLNKIDFELSQTIDKHLSANYLGDLIKKETGKSPMEHIQLKLMSLAKERIFDTGKSVSEIAYELGFKHPQHFTRMFKKEVGMSPSDYRLLN